MEPRVGVTGEVQIRIVYRLRITVGTGQGQGLGWEQAKGRTPEVIQPDHEVIS
jgi:hypothetical protein